LIYRSLYQSLDHFVPTAIAVFKYEGKTKIYKHRKIYIFIVLSVKKLEFVSHRLSYIELRFRWCNIFLNVHAPTEEKVINQRIFYEELERV